MSELKVGPETALVMSGLDVVFGLDGELLDAPVLAFPPVAEVMAVAPMVVVDVSVVLPAGMGDTIGGV